MGRRYVLAIDQGTTNTKVSLVDERGAITAEASRPVAIRYPQPGWVEQDAWDLWRTTIDASGDVLARAGMPGLAAIAVTNQRESTLIWERSTGEPLGPCVTWQCSRSAPFCDQLRAQGLEDLVHERSGLTIGPMFAAGKARWLLDHIDHGQERAASGEVCIGTVDSWLLWNLTGGRVHACDVTNASRTQLFSLARQEWDSDLLRIYNIPRAALPDVHLSSMVYGETAGSGSIPAGITIGSLIGDSHAALFGHAGFQPGSIKATYGTGSSLMTPTPLPVLSRHGLSTTVAWGYRGVSFALEGNIYVTGAAVQWLAQLLGLPNAAAVETLAQKVDGAGGIYFVPAFVGMGAPHWKQNARGLLSGVTGGTTAGHLARATLEAIAYQVRDVFEAMQAEAASPLRLLLADGGATRNDLLMQFQADILDVPVMRSLVSDASALGAAYLAGLAVGLWASLDEIAALPRPHDTFTPAMPADRRQRLYDGWQAAVARTVFKTD